MGEFQSLVEFIKALKKASEGQIDSRLIPYDQNFNGFTEDELNQLENFADDLLKQHPEMPIHKPIQ